MTESSAFTKEQWDAYKRSIAAPWDKNSQLYAVTGWENGELGVGEDGRAT